MALLDQWGRPIDLAALKEEQAAPSLTGVRQVVSGHPAQGLTPQRLAALLRDAENGNARRYLEMAEEMEERDLHYMAVLGTRKRQVSQLEITVEPASDSADDEANADLVRGFLDRDELEDELVDIMDAVGKGFSATEIIWDVSERQWMPQRLEWRMPQWFEFDRNDGRTLMLRGETGVLEPLAPWKFIQHVHKAKSGLPIRGGFARAVAWWYVFKNYAVKDWVTFVEIYGQPLRVGKYDPSATVEDKRALLRALANIGTDAAAMIPQSMMIEFVKDSSGSQTADIYQALCTYIDLLISKAVLGQTTTTDAVSGGHAVSQEHNDVRGDIERSDCRQLAATLNRDLVRPIVDLNRGPQKAYPRIVVGRPEDVDVAQLADAVSKMVPLGLRVKQAQIRQLIGLDDPEDDDELLVAPAAAAPAYPLAGLPADPTIDRAVATRRAAAARSRDAVDGVVSDVNGARPFDPLIDEVRAILDTAGTLDQARAMLLARYPTLDRGDFAEILAEAMILSDLRGRDEIGAAGGA